MKQKKFFSLPVTFTEIKSYSFDDSLIPVDIKVMHDGINLNGSTFFDEAIDSAKESLKNKPILGYVKKVDGTDTKDFAGHEVEYVFGEDGLKVVYLERPLGTVPETNNYSIQEENGKKFVACRGYLWKEYLNDGYEILKDSPSKSVSMEIAVDDYEINNDGTFNILKYRYLGITILGDNATPAMTGAELNVIGNFSEKHSQGFYEKIEELNQKLQEFSQKNDEKQEDVKEVKEEVMDKEVFELSHDDIRQLLHNILNPKNEDGCRVWNYWVMEVFQTYFIAADENEADTYWKFDYSVENDDVTVGEKERVYMLWLTQAEKDSLEQEKENFEQLKEVNKNLESELSSLKQYKEAKEQEELEETLEQERQNKIDYVNNEFSDIPENVRNIFIEKIDEFENTDQIESEICVYVVKNKVKTFSKQIKQPLKVDLEKFENTTKESPYGDLFSTKL